MSKRHYSSLSTLFSIAIRVKSNLFIYPLYNNLYRLTEHPKMYCLKDSQSINKKSFGSEIIFEKITVALPTLQQLPVA